MNSCDDFKLRQNTYPKFVLYLKKKSEDRCGEKKIIALSPLLKTESPSRPAGLRHPGSFPQHARDECGLEAHLDAPVTPAELTGYPHSFISNCRFHTKSRANQNL